jgi:hypothetical protein
MDLQIIIILLIFGVLLFLERTEKMENQKSETFVVSRPGYTNFFPTYGKQPPYAMPHSKNKDFGNFGTIGKYPPIPLCFSCDMLGNTISAPYIGINDVRSEGKVSRSCKPILGKNYNDLSRPFLVSARTAGRGRQCRRLL